MATVLVPISTRSIATIISNRPNTRAKSAGICIPNMHIIPTFRCAVSTPHLPIMLLSITQALTNKVDELEGVFKLDDVDVAVITETQLSAAAPYKCSHISGHCALPKRRPLAVGGGGGMHCTWRAQSQPNIWILRFLMSSNACG